MKGELFTSMNYEENGVTNPLNIIREYSGKEMDYAMKTASGFGGGNIALIFKKLRNGI